MKVLIGGATGFTGNYIVNQFLKHTDNYTISVFVRDPEKAIKLGFYNCKMNLFTGDFEHPKSLMYALKGQDIFICASSLGFGHAPRIIEACKFADISRTVFISTTSIFTSLNVKSKKIRIDAEKVIKNSGLDWTIMRPTMIFGAPGDRNIERLIHYIKRWPAIVVPGPGTYLMQPVYVKDLARAIFLSVKSEKTIRQEYSISGKDALSYNSVIHTIAKLTNKRITVIHLPLKFMVWIFQVYTKLSQKPKITVEQLLRLNEDKAFTHDAATKDFGYNPTPFDLVIKNEINELSKSQKT